MATITKLGNFQDKSASFIRRIGQYTGPASYATGGESLTAADLGMSRIDLLLFEPATNGTAVIPLCYDATNAKVKAFDMAGAEQGAGTNLSTYSARFEAIGL